MGDKKSKKDKNKSEKQKANKLEKQQEQKKSKQPKKTNEHPDYLTTRVKTARNSHIDPASLEMQALTALITKKPPGGRLLCNGFYGEGHFLRQPKIGQIHSLLTYQNKCSKIISLLFVSFVNEEKKMQKIVPFLWFDNQAEEAANFYTSIFDNSKILELSRYGETGPGPAGSAMVVNFQLAGQEFNALNGGPQFKFTEAISLVVNCESQAEVDYYWEKLTADGGEESMCGWLKDKYGLSWQIVPTALSHFIAGPDPAGAQRAVQAMLEMRKLDLARLQEAYERTGEKS